MSLLAAKYTELWRHHRAELNVAGNTKQPQPRWTNPNLFDPHVIALPAYSPPGSWNNERASDNCNPCAPGKYSDTIGATECKVGSASE